MLFVRVKSEGIAHNSYLVGSGGEAAVIDPRRDCEVYVSLAREQGTSIRYIFETHRNEDHVIGSTELREATGGGIFHGQSPDWGYGGVVGDGQVFEIGSLRLQAISTPGHTRESMSYLLSDTQAGGAAVMVFTGDTLFVGEVGRCDLYGPDAVPDNAAQLYDSIFSRLLPLGDGVIVCPGHGAGSVCGASISERNESTIGIERRHNPLLQLNRQDFIRRKVAERLEVPPYFSRIERYNRVGPAVLGRLPLPAQLAPAGFAAEMEKGAVVIDASEPSAFAGAHIGGAYSIWPDGVSSFAGWVAPYERPLLLVLHDESHLERAVRSLVRLGYDNIAGYLRGGTEAWYNAAFPVETMPPLSVHELRRRLDRETGLLVLDVRSDREWEAGHIEGALHVYVGRLEARLSEVPKDRAITVICGTGHRSSLGSSILLRGGFPNVFNVLGGMTAWQAAGFPVTSE